VSDAAGPSPGNDHGGPCGDRPTRRADTRRCFRRSRDRRSGSREGAIREEAVIALKRANPTYGTRRIRDVLKRFEALRSARRKCGGCCTSKAAGGGGEDSTAGARAQALRAGGAEPALAVGHLHVPLAPARAGLRLRVSWTITRVSSWGGRWPAPEGIPGAGGLGQGDRKVRSGRRRF